MKKEPRVSLSELSKAQEDVWAQFDEKFAPALATRPSGSLTVTELAERHKTGIRTAQSRVEVAMQDGTLDRALVRIAASNGSMRPQWCYFPKKK